MDLILGMNINQLKNRSKLQYTKGSVQGTIQFTLSSVPWLDYNMINGISIRVAHFCALRTYMNLSLSTHYTVKDNIPPLYVSISSLRQQYVTVKNSISKLLCLN